jgi:RNAse (barnase) inhibitor barstar
MSEMKICRLASSHFTSNHSNMPQEPWKKYQSMETFRIDGERFSSLEEFFDEVSHVLVPGYRWGHNLDAFNDILRGGFGTPEEGFILIWENAGVSKRRLDYPEAARVLEQRLETCHSTNRRSVKRELRDAQNNTGATVFDWLVEIIRIHGVGGAEAEDNVILKLQ